MKAFLDTSVSRRVHEAEKMGNAAGSETVNGYGRDNWSRQDWIFALLLVATLLLAYHPAWHGTPIWDDDAHLTKPELWPWAGLAKIWLVVGATQQYYPMAHSAFWLQHWLWGDRYEGYHLVNILLHAFSALLLVRILRRLEIRGAWLAAALWALHPVQVESVAWMSELKNTLSSVFCLSAALVYLRFHATRSRRAYAAAFGLFFLGLLTKTVIATLPAALLLVFYWKNGRLHWRKDVRPLIPFFVTGVACGLFTAWVERTLIGAHGEDFQYSLLERALIAGRVFWFYLGKLAWPADLVFIYPRWNVSSLVWWQYLYPVAALGLVAVLAGMRRRWGRGPLVATLYFAITLFPALGFLNIYPFRFSFVADHFQYLANIGPLVLAAAGAMKVIGVIESRIQRAPLLRAAFCTVLLAALALLTWRQSGIYAGKETLYRTTIARNPDCWMAYNNLGRVMFARNRYDEAAADYGKAIQLYPACDEARINLADLLLREGRPDEAISQYREACQINPAAMSAHYDLGNVLIDQGKTEEAIAEYREALRLDPGLAEGHYNLGIALMQQGRTDEGMAEYREALRLYPAYTDASLNLGVALMQQGRAEEGMAQFQDALKNNPQSAQANIDLCRALLLQGRKDDAVAQFYDFLRINPANVAAHESFGTLLTRLGGRDEAASQFREATALNPSDAAAGPR